MERQAWIIALALGALAISPASAQDEAPFVPETLTVKETIDPGPNVFLNTQEWSGAGGIEVFSADDFTYKGNMTMGAMGQFLISPDGTTAYGLSTFMSRYMYGDTEHVLTVYDIETLSVTGEVVLPPKAAMVAAYEPLLQASADGRYVYVQNATPATSVTVVDVEAMSVVGEVPTPGCWGIYPALEGYKFSSICGDGTFATFTLGEEGADAERAVSEQIFDVDEDPIFVPAVRIDGDLVFMSYHGNLYTLSDEGDAIELVSTVSITEGIDEEWAPGGYGLLAYSPTPGILFVPMHSEPYDGSHKNASEEIWAYDVEAGEVLYRTIVEGVISLAATDEEAPVLYAINEHEGTVMSFSTDPEAKFVLKEIAEAGTPGWATIVTVRQ